MIMDVHIKNLDTFAGKGVNVVENPKSTKRRDKQFFMKMVDMISKMDDRTNILMDMGIDLIRYEDPYFNLIENLIIKSYGPLKGGIILWWCGERKLLEGKIYNMIDESGNSTQITNVNQLYTYLSKLK